MPNLDFSNVPKREPLPEGIYLMLIEKVEAKVSSSGNDMLLVRFKNIETNTAVFENYVLLPQNMWKLQELCDAVGIDTDDIRDTDDLIPQLEGAEVNVKVTQDEYQGRITNRAKKVFAL